jgi:hypothetical protein
MPSRSNSTHTARVIDDPGIPGGLLLELPDQLCLEVDWRIGDTLEWIDNKDGTFSLKKT